MPNTSGLNEQAFDSDSANEIECLGEFSYLGVSEIQLADPLARSDPAVDSSEHSAAACSETEQRNCSEPDNFEANTRPKGLNISGFLESLINSPASPGIPETLTEEQPVTSPLAVPVMSDKENKAVADRFQCTICNKNLRITEPAKQLQHINRCVAKKDREIQQLEKDRQAMECPLCKDSLTPGPHRIAHLKKCALDNGVPSCDLVRLVRAQENVVRAKHLQAINCRQLSEAQIATIDISGDEGNSLQPESDVTTNCEKDKGYLLSSKISGICAANAIPDGSMEAPPGCSMLSQVVNTVVTNVCRGKRPVPRENDEKKTELKPPERCGKSAAKKRRSSVYDLKSATEEERLARIQEKVFSVVDGSIVPLPAPSTDGLLAGGLQDDDVGWWISAARKPTWDQSAHADTLIGTSLLNSSAYMPTDMPSTSFAGPQHTTDTESTCMVDLSSCEEPGPLIGDLKRLFEDRDVNGDLSLLISDDRSIKIHRLIMDLRCPKLLKEVMENPDRCLNVTNESAMLNLLRYVYYGWLGFDAANISAVLALAERFDLMRLADHCRTLLGYLGLPKPQDCVASENSADSVDAFQFMCTQFAAKSSSYFPDELENPRSADTSPENPRSAVKNNPRSADTSPENPRSAGKNNPRSADTSPENPRSAGKNNPRSSDTSPENPRSVASPAKNPGSAITPPKRVSDCATSHSYSPDLFEDFSPCRLSAFELEPSFNQSQTDTASRVAAVSPPSSLVGQCEQRRSMADQSEKTMMSHDFPSTPLIGGLQQAPARTGQSKARQRSRGQTELTDRLDEHLRKMTSSATAIGPNEHSADQSANAPPSGDTDAVTSSCGVAMETNDRPDVQWLMHFSRPEIIAECRRLKTEARGSSEEDDNAARSLVHDVPPPASPLDEGLTTDFLLDNAVSADSPLVNGKPVIGDDSVSDSALLEMPLDSPQVEMEAESNIIQSAAPSSAIGQPECSSSSSSCETPLTSLRRRGYRILKTVGVTPKPDFTKMSSPELKRELCKYGIAAHSRKKAVIFLNQIYEETHPEIYITTPLGSNATKSGSAESTSLRQRISAKKHPKGDKPKAVTSHPKSPPPPEIGVSGGTTSSYETPLLQRLQRKTGRRPVKSLEPPSPKVPPILSLDAALSGESSCDSGDEPDGECLEESFMMASEVPESQVPPSQQVGTTSAEDLNERLMALFKSSPDFYQDILAYKPIPFKEFKERVREARIRPCSTAAIMDFLDKQCITFTLKEEGRAKKFGQKPKRGRRAGGRSQKGA